MIWYFVGYVVLINLVTFALFGIDKKRAKQHEAYARAQRRRKKTQENYTEHDSMP